MAEADPDKAGVEKEAAAPAQWRHVWQVPLTAGAVLALAGAVVMAVATRPKPDLGVELSRAQALVEAKEFAPALVELNTKALPNTPKMSKDQLRLFHLLRARALYMGQKDAGINRAENHISVVNEYREAEKLNAELTSRDIVNLAETHLALGELDEAAQRVEKVPLEMRAERVELLRGLVTKALLRAKPDTARAMEFVAVMTADPGLSLPDRLWGLARQADMLVAQGYAEEAIDKILRTLPLLVGGPAVDEGGVRLALAKAYVATNDMERAQAQLSQAAALLGTGSDLMPQVLLAQAETAHRNPRTLDVARERYTTIIEQYGFASELAAALLGLGEAEAETSNNLGAEGEGRESLLDQSVTRYMRFVELAERGDENALAIKERAGQSLLARFRDQYEGQRPQLLMALRYASLGERLFGIDAAPPDLVLALAQVHRALAGELLGASGDGSSLSLAETDPATQREAREHLLRAGEYFRVHAGRVVQKDATLYAESLWAGADAFDRAGDMDASIAAFQQFAKDFGADIRRPEALFRMAQAYRARGDLELAERVYRGLMESRGQNDRSGPFADASYVPLAQTLLSDGKRENDGEAVRLLHAVVSGTVGGTQTPMFRAALLELANQSYRGGEFERAIERYVEYLQRGQGPSGTEDISVRYRLADSYRMSSRSISRALMVGAMPEGERRKLASIRDERLVKAATLYEGVRRDFDAMPRRTAIEDLYLRNACFYLGDCAFDQGDFETAIRHYDAAKDRYSKDPASLVAMVQIVSALLAQGEKAKAAVANARAKRFYEGIPASAWEDPALPMKREDWERWLTSQEELSRQASGPGD